MKRLSAALGTVAYFAQFAFAASDPVLERQFTNNIHPVITQYCAGCHSGSAPAAQLDLKTYSTLESVVRDYPRWALVLKRVTTEEMPPKQAPPLPPDGRKQLTDWIQAVRAGEIRKHAGDPGPVLARRLSNAEYNYVIRDLTGVDLRPAKEFPVDPANQAGFDNSSESLTTSPALMTKYLNAARETADHLVLKPDGLAFSAWPALVETDRERYSVQKILEFYQRQPTDFASYFQAAWRYKHRAALGEPKATLSAIAAETKVSSRYLGLVLRALEQEKEEVGPLFKLQTMWHQLPEPQSGQPEAASEEAVRSGCVRMRDFVVKIRRHTEKLFDPPAVQGMNANFQPFVVWRNREILAHRRDFDRAALRVAGEPVPVSEFVITRGPIFGGGEKVTVEQAIADYKKDRQQDADLAVPAGERARYEAAFARFSAVFPTAFYLRERGRFYPVDSYDQGRYLGAGFHSVTGYFRDDAVLSELILDEKGKKELDKLWQDFEFIADYTGRTWEQFLFNGGGGGRGLVINKPIFDKAKSQEAVYSLRDQYLKAVPADKPEVAKALIEHFGTINSAMRWLEKARAEAEPLQLQALLKFASHAYRRPLASDERDEILGYYRDLRTKSKLTQEESMRASIVSLLVSPDFLYRVDMRDNAPAHKTADSVSLSGYAIANRLSFFLWSSMPDEELTEHAAAGDLTKPAVLAAQVRRMIKDDRVRGFATEFAGNWLGFRGFETLNSVDRERFPAFNEHLRDAMFEEPIRFFVNVLRSDRPALDFLYGNYTFVNPVLAKHYGMPEIQGDARTWVRVDNANQYGRGGLLPMSVFLTLNAPGLRTSPVKRGYWVARRVLGEAIPPPPPVVPELPHDEAKSDLPIRELLAQHRQNSMCASCHARFDSFGLTFENYGPVGDRRTKDLAGRPVDTHGTYPGGEQGQGLEGLQGYIRAHREKDFLNNLTEKLLVYALGRSQLISDEPLLETMRMKLAASDYKLSALIDTIVASPQFLNRRNSQRQQARIAPQTGE